MSKPDATVTLNVKPIPESGTPSGWTQSPNEPGYIYQFTGGNTDFNNGDLDFDDLGHSKKIVLLLADSMGSDYTIYNVGFFNNDHSLSRDFNKASIKSASKATIKDDDGVVGSGYFKAWVDPQNSDKRIECDPRWKNN